MCADGPAQPATPSAETPVVTQALYTSSGEPDAEVEVYATRLEPGEAPEARLRGELRARELEVLAERRIAERDDAPDLLTRGTRGAHVWISRWTALPAPGEAADRALLLEARAMEASYPRLAETLLEVVMSFEARAESPAAAEVEAELEGDASPTERPPPPDAPRAHDRASPSGTATAHPAAARGEWEEPGDGLLAVGRRFRVAISGPAIDAGGWILTGAEVTEALNEPYVVYIDARTDRLDADARSLIGTPCALSMHRGESEQRVVGIVTEVRQGDARGQHSIGRLVVEPALRALERRHDTRIFQEKTVPEILDAVLGDALAPWGRSVSLELTRTYPPREYTVQYRETDFDFAHRLMEEEGILYHFDHDGEAEVMTLLDDRSQHGDLQGPTGRLVEYSDRELGAAAAIEEERVFRFESLARLSGTRVVSRHFDWTHPSVPITGESGDSDAGPTLESYVHDAPLTYHSFESSYQAHDAATQTQLLRELQVRDAHRTDGASTVPGLRPSCRFDLNMHPRLELNTSYVVVRATHRYLEPATRDGGGRNYSNTFECVPASVQWRPDRTRDRPRIHSVQTATVVGPAGEEIHTDPHGRVKVQFHWDRLGGRDDRSSCWIRVVQAMGGAGWGFSFIPRIGMEVVITFVEGDPDRPLVSGAVYNPDNPPPCDYPSDKTRTTIKSNSSPGGGGFNELRLEDKAGQEEIFLHGQKDWNTVINHDHTRSVGNNETEHVALNRVRTVGENETISVGVDRVRTVGQNETLEVGLTRTRQVGENEVISIALDRTKSVGVNETLSVGGNRTRSVAGVESVSVGADQNVSVAASRASEVGGDDTVAVAGARTVQVGLTDTRQVGAAASYKVGGALSEKVGGSRTRSVGSAETITIGVNQMINVGAARQVNVAGVHTLAAGAMMVLTAGSKLDLVCGSAKISLSSGGKITITGSEVEIASSGLVVVNGTEIHLN